MTFSKMDTNQPRVRRWQYNSTMWATCLFLSILSTKAFADIFVIEGMCGAGKSTTLIRLAPKLQDRFYILSELNPEPDCEWQNESVEEQGRHFYDLWVARMRILKNDFPRSANFLLDRCYIGSMAFTYAMD